LPRNCLPSPSAPLRGAAAGGDRADLIQATALNVAEGTRIFHSLMVHFENEVPVQIEDRCVNAAVVPDYLHQDYTATTPHDYLSLIAPLTEGEHIVEAVQATRKSARCCIFTPTIPAC
jgi:GntR family histidine utilization transcriptional repressor